MTVIDRIVRITASSTPATDRITKITASYGPPGAVDRITKITASYTPDPGGPGYTVNAGPNQAVEPFTTVTLTATSTGSPDSWAWDQVAGPDVPLTGSDTNSVTFLADAYKVTTQLVFRAFGITDGNDPATDDVTVTVYGHTLYDGDDPLILMA